MSIIVTDLRDASFWRALRLPPRLRWGLLRAPRMWMEPKDYRRRLPD